MTDMTDAVAAYAPSVPLRFIQRVEFPRKLGVCEQLFARRLTRLGIVWASTPGGSVWKLDLTMPSHRWAVYGQHDRGLVRYLQQRLSPDAVIVDSGANIGQMLLSLIENVPYGRYYAFEPEEEASDWLADCLAMNALTKVELVRAALGAASGWSYLAKPRGSHGAQSFVSDSFRDQAVRMMALQEFLNDRGIPRVDFWKIDVEGYELSVLQGAETFLKAGRIRDLYVELSREESYKVRGYLDSFGYRCFEVRKNGELRSFVDRGLVITDALFSRD